ncbi:EF-hand domain-containing protein [Pseudoxanthomonas suwonensis]|uniref:EF-hand domain-containing protein n=1 Tax=Pseudoxanthomonas suwonensis TaxID=314722 RepID=UPI000466E0E8|nr:EF-hand domain-containing protein [Pseudoxanthomonas suwonensis]
MKKTPSLIAAALLAMTAGVAAAQTTTPAAAPAKAERKALDANGDGVVDRSEAAAFPRLAARFDELDRDKDGKLQAGELPRHGKGHHGRFGHGPKGGFMALDTDKDGRISKAEAAAKPRFAERFAKLDVNGDGFLDKADRELAMKKRNDAWFTEADTDKNGKLSKAEFDAAHAKRMAERGQHRAKGGSAQK